MSKVDEKEVPTLSGEQLAKALITEITSLRYERDELKTKQREDDEKERKVTEESVKGEYERQKAQPKFWITIHRLNEDDHEVKMYVGVNGVSYWIEKEVRIPLPKCVVGNLTNAEQISTFTEYDEITQQRVKKTIKRRQYPFSNEGPADPVEVKAWEKDNLTSLDR